MIGGDSYKVGENPATHGPDYFGNQRCRWGPTIRPGSINDADNLRRSFSSTLAMFDGVRTGRDGICTCRDSNRA